MTNEEAKNILFMEWQDFLERKIDYGGVTEAYNKAFEALKRDTPKKVNIEQWIATECPNGCGYTLSTHHGDGYYSIDDKPKFCPLCGQRLDWGEEDDKG